MSSAFEVKEGGITEDLSKVVKEQGKRLYQKGFIHIEDGNRKQNY